MTARALDAIAPKESVELPWTDFSANGSRAIEWSIWERPMVGEGFWAHGR
jgi:hypothetical protein